MAFMDAALILTIFLVLRVLQHLFEHYLSRLNRAYYLNDERRRVAADTLGIDSQQMASTLNYTEDKYRFGIISGWVSLLATLVFIGFGGLGWVESLAGHMAIALDGGDIVHGLLFFAVLGLASTILSLPFSYYKTFHLEERHGYNRQTLKGFAFDLLKGLLLAVILGGLLVSAILWIMSAAGSLWWLWAWVAMTGFSLLSAWLYPTYLAPLFNKFTALTDGDLKQGIDRLAERIGFRADGVFLMDASTRSSHGNAYFTGVGAKKRIVLFDTLVEAMSVKEVIAVLAHELGHFKLKHVRWALIRGTLMTGLTFFLLSRVLPLELFYEAFGLAGISSYGALVVFGLWFGLLDFVLQPLMNELSRRNEFSADAFATANLDGDTSLLASALLKLREKSNAMPLAHPWYSKFYHSHPPLMERLAAMKQT